MDLKEEVIEAAEEVHDTLGPGFTEAVYHSAILTELSARGHTTSTETSIPIMYKGHPVGTRRPDLLVEGEDDVLVVELKAGSDRGENQLLQYVDLLEDDNNIQIDEGLLIQFNDTLEVHDNTT